jgi:hypothetical protein
MNLKRIKRKEELVLGKKYLVLVCEDNPSPRFVNKWVITTWVSGAYDDNARATKESLAYFEVDGPHSFYWQDVDLVCKLPSPSKTRARFDLIGSLF